jgi:hypothetical protein
VSAAQLFQAFMQAVADDGTTIVLLLIIGITGVRRWWVLGREMEALKAQLTDERVEHMRQWNELREERDTWRRLALMHGAHQTPEGDD